MARKKKVDVFTGIVNKALEKIEGVLDKITMRDLIYLTSFISASFLAYKMCQELKAITIKLTFNDWAKILFQFGALYIFPTRVGQEEIPEEIDHACLAASMVAAYMVLKIDIDDIKSALSSITSTIKKNVE